MARRDHLLLLLTFGSFVLLMMVVLGVAYSRAFDAIFLYERGETANLDGLRGFLAFGVFLSHAAFYHGFVRSGGWADPPVTFLKLGQIGVTLFFMITGFLFWRKLIEENGRPDWIRLYVGRVFRIGPLYLFAVTVMLAIIAERTGFALQVPVHDLILQIAHWLPMGFNGGGSDVNGAHSTGLILLGVTWTLGSEWKYYLALFPLALFCRRETTHLPFAASLVVASAIYSLLRPDLAHAAPSIRVMLFALGMLSASLQANRVKLSLPNPAGGLAVIALLAGVVALRQPTYSVLPGLMLGFVFFLIVSGEDIFGLLNTIAARRIGEVSYGIYLLQGLMFTLFFSIKPLRDILLGSDVLFAIHIALCAIALLFFAYATFIWIELPGIRLGRQIGLRLTGWTRTGQEPVAAAES